jgi:hypothetical protein
MTADASAGPPIQRADPRARRRARWLVLAALPLLAGAAVGSELIARWLETLARERPAEAVAPIRLAIVGLSAATVLPLLGFAAWTWRLAGRVAAARRFPPPGVAVVYDVRVLEGHAALVYAGMGRALALGLAACALALAWIARLLLLCLERSAATLR